MHELFGIHKGEFHGQLNDWVSRIHPEDLESTKGRFMAAIEKGEAFEAQYRIIGPDQNVKWLDSRAHVVRNRLGVPISLLGITTDITLSKEAEAKIEKALDEAKRANEAKSEFLAVMSHEIRTPLSGLIGILEILQEKRLEREAKDLVATALSSSSHLLTVLSDVLEFSRIEAGKLDIVEAPFSLNLMLKQIVALHFSSAKNKELELLLVKPEEDYVCIGDEQRIRQIIGNYLGNAIKFTENGKIKLECDADLDVSSKVLSTKIIVHDNGIGIPKDRLASLFTPFEQVDSSRTRSFGGTGLGLSICKKLAEQMGGQVGVESVEGEGSSFYVKLDLPIGTLEDTYQNIKQSIKELPRLKILAAEDVALNQFILKTMVGDKMKQDLTVVTNGLEVLECLQSSEFDVVLMDVQMPEMDGVTATETIRQSAEEYNDIPIIGLTANALESQQKEYISAGMSACISKPLNWEELTNVLSELVVK
ncbi:MAG: response regulator [Sneathiella sp.]|nr:response regulator [Sneathiella sp.]